MLGIRGACPRWWWSDKGPKDHPTTPLPSLKPLLVAGRVLRVRKEKVQGFDMSRYAGTVAEVREQIAQSMMPACAVATAVAQ